jgi:hypothetical protein
MPLDTTVVLIILALAAVVGAVAYRIRTMHIADGAGQNGLDEETVAVLAAAATETLKRPVSVRRVRFLTPGAEPTWAVVGRLNIMASHAIVRRKS